MKRNLIIFSTVLFLAATGTASADVENRRNERIGVGSGVLVGAATGGPVGAIIGAAIGGKVGSRVTGVGEVERMSGELDAANTAIRHLETELDESTKRVARLSRERTQEELEEALSDGVNLNVMYATGQAELTPESRRLLTDLAVLLESVPGLGVRLDGYADRRGDADYNDRLSQARVDGVRDELLGQGVDHTRIETEAHGARTSKAADGDLDAYALERRVNIRLIRRDDTGVVASN